MSQTLELGAYGSSIGEVVYIGPVVIDDLDLREPSRTVVFMTPFQFKLKLEFGTLDYSGVAELFD